MPSKTKQSPIYRIAFYFEIELTDRDFKNVGARMTCFAHHRFRDEESSYLSHFDHLEKHLPDALADLALQLIHAEPQVLQTPALRSKLIERIGIDAKAAVRRRVEGKPGRSPTAGLVMRKDLERFTKECLDAIKSVRVEGTVTKERIAAKMYPRHKNPTRKLRVEFEKNLGASYRDWDVSEWNTDN